MSTLKRLSRQISFNQMKEALFALSQRVTDLEAFCCMIMEKAKKEQEKDLGTLEVISETTDNISNNK